MQGKRNEAMIAFLLARRSVLAANLTEPGPSQAELDEIIKVGLRVPDHGRCGSWRIQIIGKKGQARLGDLYASLFAKDSKNVSAMQIDYWRKRPQSAPILLAIACYPNKEKVDKIPLWEQVLSGGALCQNILNASHAMGYSAQWLTEWPAYHKDVRCLLGHDEKTDLFGFIFIGSAKEAPKERKRVKSHEIVSYWN